MDRGALSTIGLQSSVWNEVDLVLLACKAASGTKWT